MTFHVRPALPDPALASRPFRGLKVLLVGHDLPMGLVEQALLRHGTGHYLCVETLDAARWLMEEGPGPDLVVAAATVFDGADAVRDWRRRHPRIRLVMVPGGCDLATLTRRMGAALTDMGTDIGKPGAMRRQMPDTTLAMQPSAVRRV
jgi:hypothetical protein